MGPGVDTSLWVRSVDLEVMLRSSHAEMRERFVEAVDGEDGGIGKADSSNVGAIASGSWEVHRGAGCCCCGGVVGSDDEANVAPCSRIGVFSLSSRIVSHSMPFRSICCLSSRCVLSRRLCSLARLYTVGGSATMVFDE